MDAATKTAESLRAQIEATEEQLRKLKEQLADLEDQNTSQNVQESDPVTQRKWPLSLEEYKRYGRQMIVPSIGNQGYYILNHKIKAKMEQANFVSRMHLFS